MSDKPSSETPPFGEADLSNCEREPIHVPGSIQPHGALLAVTEPDLTIVQLSENAPRFLGLTVDQLRYVPLAAALGDRAFAELRERHLSAPSLAEANPVALEVGATGSRSRFDGVLHRSGGLLVLELEPAPPRDDRYVDAFVRSSRRAIARLEDAPTLRDLLDRVANEVQALTGFDRVMVYRFDPEWHGEVVAEARREGIEPFLGLRYPASDIPRQARELYTRNWLRLIADVTYVPARLVPFENPLSGAPLDLSGSVLRSVSPLHLEYLQNMGVAASMSISLLKDGQLWGLVACHHHQPRLVPYEVRTVCEFLGRILSWQLSTKVDAEAAERRARSKASQTRFLQAMSIDLSLSAALFRAERDLLEFVGASGVALVHEGAVQTAGSTPPAPWLRELADWLATERPEDVFATDELPALHPRAAAHEDVASGLLAVCISREQREYLLWFRPEVLRTVTWGGDPTKPVAPTSREQGLRLSPRKSFAAWKELVRLHSAPWEVNEVEAAHDLRVSLLALLVRRAAELKKLNEDLRSALRARDDFVSVAAHELRTPISTLSMQVHNLLRSKERAAADDEARQRGRLEIAGRQVRRLEQLVEILLDVTRVRSGQLRVELTDGVSLDDVLDTTIGKLASGATVSAPAIGRDGRRGIRGRWDALRVEQVATNLLSNAIKYGAGRPITVTTGADADRAWISVEDQGIGIAPEALARIFDRFERGVSSHDYAGLGLGLWISRQIAERLGGDITARSEPGKGSTFTVFLPIAGPAAPSGRSP